MYFEKNFFFFRTLFFSVPLPIDQVDHSHLLKSENPPCCFPYGKEAYFSACIFRFFELSGSRPSFQFFLKLPKVLKLVSFILKVCLMFTILNPGKMFANSQKCENSHPCEKKNSQICESENSSTNKILNAFDPIYAFLRRLFFGDFRRRFSDSQIRENENSSTNRILDAFDYYIRFVRRLVSTVIQESKPHSCLIKCMLFSQNHTLFL